MIVVLDSLSNQQALRYSGMEVELPTSGGNWKVVRDGKSKDWLVVDTKGRTKLAKALIGLKRARKRLGFAVAVPFLSKHTVFCRVCRGEEPSLKCSRMLSIALERPF